MGTGELNAESNPAVDYKVSVHQIQGGVEILLAASPYRNRDKLCLACVQPPLPSKKCHKAFFLLAVKRRNFKNVPNSLWSTTELTRVDRHIENLPLQTCEPRKFWSAWITFNNLCKIISEQLSTANNRRPSPIFFLTGGTVHRLALTWWASRLPCRLKIGALRNPSLGACSSQTKPMLWHFFADQSSFRLLFLRNRTLPVYMRVHWWGGHVDKIKYAD